MRLNGAILIMKCNIKILFFELTFYHPKGKLFYYFKPHTSIKHSQETKFVHK